MEKNIIEKYYENGQDLEKALVRHIFMIVNRDQIDEDENQCQLCTDICYLSMIQCTKHTLREDPEQVSTHDEHEHPKEAQPKAVEQANQYCIHHLNYCKCPAENYRLIYRYSTKELEGFLAQIEAKIEAKISQESVLK